MKLFPVICSLIFAVAVFVQQATLSAAFVSPRRTTTPRPAQSAATVARPTPLFAEQKKKGRGLDESVRTKLVSESIAPWRTLRLFLYGALGSGALVGGLVTLTGTAALLSGSREGELNTEVGTLVATVWACERIQIHSS